MICNRPDNGLAAIEHFGEEHVRTGALILYTSQDSVLQIAAHVDACSPDGAVRGVRAARELMSGEHAVGRVIARPFAGARRARSSAPPGRRDFALRRPGRSYLEELERRRRARSTGSARSRELFAGRGVERDASGRDQRAGARRASTRCSSELPAGSCSRT